jgi:hypothetical protein
MKLAFAAHCPASALPIASGLASHVLWVYAPEFGTALFQLERPPAVKRLLLLRTQAGS